jgi:hypothetical protein
MSRLTTPMVVQQITADQSGGGAMCGPRLCDYRRGRVRLRLDAAGGNLLGRPRRQNVSASQLRLPDDPRAITPGAVLEPGRSGLGQALSPPADASLPRWSVGRAFRLVSASPDGRAVPRLGLRGHRVPASNPLAAVAGSAVSHLARQGVEGAVRAESAVVEDCEEEPTLKANRASGAIQAIGNPHQTGFLSRGLELRLFTREIKSLLVHLRLRNCVRTILSFVSHTCGRSLRLTWSDR